MYIYLSKILPLFILPIGIVFELLFIALFLLWRGKNKPATFFVVVAMAVLWVCSVPIVARSILGNLEQQYTAIPLSEIPESKCLVLLGGSIEPVRPPRVDVNLLDSVDRISKTASLYRSSKASMVIVSGGNQPWSLQWKSESEETRDLLLEWGVPVSAMVLDKTSRNTRENAVNSTALLKQYDCGTPLLVTSAAHMTRSVASFAKLGIDVFPVPTDVRAIHTLQLTVFDFIPDSGSLGMTTNAVREWVGQLVYRIRGWN